MNVTESSSHLGAEVVVHAHKFFAPGRFVSGGSVKTSDKWGAAAHGHIRVGARNHRQNGLGIGVDGNCGGIRDIRAIRTRAHIAKISEPGSVKAALGVRGHRHVENLPGDEVATPPFGEEEEGLILPLVVAEKAYRSADRIPEFMLLKRRSLFTRRIEEIPGIERVVSAEVIHVTVECIRPGLRLHLDGSGAVAAILRTVIGGEHLELGDGIEAGIHVQRGVAAVIHVVAAVDLPVVVLGSAAIHAVGNIAVHPDRPLILPGLAHHAGNQRD